MAQKKFGTFLGVFVPSMLTILGLIMYLRFGWVLGNVGLAWTWVIVILASSITLITGLSASAIATNMLVGVGGEYYMVSRSLGLEFGGAIGIPLYFCRTLSVTFYCFGLAETMVLFWPNEWGQIPPWAVQSMAAGTIVIITILSGKSAEMVLKAQIPIFVFVGLSIAALIIGTFTGPLQVPNWGSNYTTAPQGFWYVFAVFFPAVTGFTAGIGLSGDLKDPKKSIPIGTLGAVLVCMAIYLIIPSVIGVSGKVSAAELQDASQGSIIWSNIALFGGFFVFPAVLGAILSSAFGSILSGPRVLQALSKDGLAPSVFGKLSKTGQPTYATWLSGAIALAAVALGGLNAVAQFVSVLFLTLYVVINLSAALEVLVGEPHYRPKIRVPWYISVLGAAGALGVMFLINPLACVLAILVEIGVFIYLRRRSLEQKWGDVVAGLWINIAKWALRNHSLRGITQRNWRPQILLFSKDVKRNPFIIKLASAISQNKGILTIMRLIPLQEYSSAEQLAENRIEFQKDINALNVEAFCEVQVVQNVRSSMISIAEAHGIAGLKSNTIMEGFSEEQAGRIQQLIKLRDMARSGKNIIYARFRREAHKLGLGKKEITIWWRGGEKNGDLMLLLAYLMRLDKRYQDYAILIKSVVNSKPEAEALEKLIQIRLEDARIKARIQVLVSQGKATPIIKKESLNSEIVFIGLALPEPGKEGDSSTRLAQISEDIPNTIFVYNAGMANAVPELLK